MDPKGNIYPLPNGERHPEDEARLDGYLRGLGADDETREEEIANLREQARVADAKVDFLERLRKAGM